MKIRPTDYAALDSAIRTVWNPTRHADYRANGLSDTRFYWDMLWESGFAVTPLYAYLADSHIETAIRAIVATLE